MWVHPIKMKLAFLDVYGCDREITLLLSNYYSTPTLFDLVAVVSQLR